MPIQWAFWGLLDLVVLIQAILIFETHYIGIQNNAFYLVQSYGKLTTVSQAQDVLVYEYLLFISLFMIISLVFNLIVFQIVIYHSMFTKHMTSKFQNVNTCKKTK